MDRMPPSEGGDAGSIPAEGTTFTKVDFWVNLGPIAPVVQWIGRKLAEFVM